VIHNFQGNDGAFPTGALAVDSTGDLYGAASQGGSSKNYGSPGLIFRLSLGVVDAWTETILHVFGGDSDGVTPNRSLIFDSSGSLYGTTQHGGTGGCGYNCGTIFKLTPVKTAWKETVLYNFQGAPDDGSLPQAGLTFDSAGKLYGTNFGRWNLRMGYRYGTRALKWWLDGNYSL